MNAGRADEGAPSLLLNEIPLAAKLLHRPPDGDPADGVLRAELRLRGNLLFRLVFSVFDGGFDIVFDLLVQGDKGVFGHNELLFQNGIGCAMSL